MQRSREVYTALLTRRPHVAVSHTGATITTGVFIGLQLNKGSVRLHPENTSLLTEYFQSAALGSLGLSDREISNSMYRPEKTVNRQLVTTYRQTGVLSRSGLARYFLEHQAYEIERRGEPLRLDEQDKQIVELYSHGLTLARVAQELDITPGSVRGRVAGASNRNGLTGIESVVMGSLLSGEVGNFV